MVKERSKSNIDISLTEYSNKSFESKHCQDIKKKLIKIASLIHFKKHLKEVIFVDEAKKKKILCHLLLSMDLKFYM